MRKDMTEKAPRPTKWQSKQITLNKFGVVGFMDML